MDINTIELAPFELSSIGKQHLVDFVIVNCGPSRFVKVNGVQTVSFVIWKCKYYVRENVSLYAFTSTV